MPVLANPDDAAVAFQSAWNAHDMHALGGMFTPDATFVNRFGRLVRGADEIVAMHAPIHETVYRDSTLENEVIDVRHIGEDVAIVHFWSRLSAGDHHPAGPHQVDTLVLAVLTKQETGWLICAFENVTLTNPRTGETILRDAAQ
jgi:uncharacterized protein (TIGR02246 family)